MTSLAERFPRLLPELRPARDLLLVLDLTRPPAKGARPILARLASPPTLPDPAKISIENVVVEGGSGDDLRLMVIRPAGAEVHPVILSIHGGGSVVGTPEMDIPLNCFFAEQGFAVVSPEYRLAPEHPYPAQQDDVEAAFDYINTEAAAKLHGFDSSKIAFYGCSAGAWLSTSLAIRLNQKKSANQAKIVVATSFAGDDRVIYPAQANDHPLASYFIWTAQNSRDIARYIFGEENATSLPVEAAPLRAKDDSEFKGLPPHYIDCCELDSLVDQGPAYATRLLAAGVTTELHLWARTFHGFAHLAPDTKIARVAWEEYVRVIKTALADA